MKIINHQVLHAGTRGIPIIHIEGADSGRYHVYAKVYTTNGDKKITLCRFRSSTWIKALERGRDVARNFSLFKALFWKTVKNIFSEMDKKKLAS